MAVAAHTFEPANPTTGKDCLLAVVRWLLFILLLHWLIARGRKLVVTLGHRIPAPDLARINHGLSRAAALQVELFALRPTAGDLDDIERRRAICAVIMEICTDLGVFRGEQARAAAKALRQRTNEWTRLAPIAPLSQSSPAIRQAATGPPQSPPTHLNRKWTSMSAARRCLNASICFLRLPPGSDPGAVCGPYFSAPPRLCVESCTT